MQYRLRIWPAVLLALVAAGSMKTSAWAQRTQHSTVQGRQRVRAALAAAMTDGKLSKKEAESIYGRAEKLLSAEELPGLRRTLGRLASLPSTSSQSSAPAESVEQRPTTRQSPAPAPQIELALSDDLPMVDDLPVVDEPPVSAEEKKGVAQSASYQEPAKPYQPPAGHDLPVAEGVKPAAEALKPLADAGLESPFQEEGRLERDELWDDTVVVEDCCFDLLGRFQALDVDGWRNLSLYSTVDAFKGPLDLDGRNGNFGFTFALNVGIPISRAYGVGFQAGTSGVLTNFYGTQFTGSTVRSQNFTTVGLFQQIPVRYGNLKWGFGYDFFHDRYFDTLTTGQWRVKLGYELDPCREIGIWASIPDKGAGARLGDPITGYTDEWFKPVSQGNLYYSRCWQSGISTTTWLGIAEEPGEWVLGADARIPLSGRLALVGRVNYISPSASAEPGQDEEMWSLSMGIEWRPRARTNHCLGTGQYAPLLPLADNSTFAMRRF